MQGAAHPEDRFPPASAENVSVGRDRPSSVGSAGVVGDPSNGSSTLAETELDSALQLLVERAQYITGATGTALALPQGEEMVCRASAGSSAPAVGARLQVRSGLTGESIARRQLLRCDNAEADPRVNLEACRALGIASIVVLPLLRRNGEVRGLFELFSDHPYAFEERDLIALERMAALTLTALDLAEQRQSAAPPPAARREPQKPVEPYPELLSEVSPEPLAETSPELVPGLLPEISTASSAPQAAANPVNVPLDIPVNIPINTPVNPEFAEASIAPAEPLGISSSSFVMSPVTTPAPVPEAMLRVQKCDSCGFPVSDGRTLCLDCERKVREKKDFEKKQRAQEQHRIEQGEQEQAAAPASTASESAAFTAPAQKEDEFVPAFLANAVPVQESWLANHVNLLAIFVLILGILVAVVVFR